MAIITGGYDGTVDEVQFAGLIPRYSVVGPDDFKATTQAGDRIVSIGNGTALGPGTIDVATNLPAIQHAVATGTRWDLVALRRDWQPPGGASSIVIIQGGATKGYPDVGTAATAWNRRPGIMDDQPLYLQEVSGTLLGVRVDVRCWAAHGGVVAGSEDAKTYLQQLGTEFRADGVIHRYVKGTNGVAGWQDEKIDKSINGGAPTDLTGVYSGWTRPFTTGPRRPRVWSADGVTAHSSGVLQAGATVQGNMLTIPSAYAPAPGAITYVNTVIASNGSQDPVGGAVIELGIENNTLQVVYQSKSVAVGSYVPVHGSWLING